MRTAEADRRGRRQRRRPTASASGPSSTSTSPGSARPRAPSACTTPPRPAACWTCAAPAPGEPDRRGWEWSYLDQWCNPELRTIALPTAAESHSVAVSPDGRLLAVGCSAPFAMGSRRVSARPGLPDQPPRWPGPARAGRAHAVRLRRRLPTRRRVPGDPRGRGDDPGLGHRQRAASSGPSALVPAIGGDRAGGAAAGARTAGGSPAPPGTARSGSGIPRPDGRRPGSPRTPDPWPGARTGPGSPRAGRDPGWRSGPGMPGTERLRGPVLRQRGLGPQRSAWSPDGRRLAAVSD